ncbi:hypothetical protein Fmac_012164 [Flemingia macrophylla]|uniref:Uncharacterized protein n=1 Tax=Flemingia macrophylla TaxID=520843 RepID=A0ABD1MPJ3_9FABA
MQTAGLAFTSNLFMQTTAPTRTLYQLRKPSTKAKASGVPLVEFLKRERVLYSEVTAIKRLQQLKIYKSLASEEKFEGNFSQARSEAASCGGGSESSPMDPVQEEKIRNQSWIVAVGGVTNKGRLYGVGKVSYSLRLGDTFTNISSGQGNNLGLRKNSSIRTGGSSITGAK